QKNDSCRLGAGVTGEVTVHYTYDGGTDSRHPGNGPSLVLSRFSPISLRATELATNRQTSDGLSWKPSPGQRFPGRLF
ncbi:hypothetical protein HAX54_013865, partial [Datura stramonium]|nr:hypothetical protein [Datura stramonium]